MKFPIGLLAFAVLLFVISAFCILTSITISETHQEPLSMTSAPTVLRGAAVFSIVLTALLAIPLFANHLGLFDGGDESNDYD